MAQDKSDLQEGGGARQWKPVLGLSDETGERVSVPVRLGTVYDQPEP